MSSLPTKIGPYEIIRPLGKGGMGVVFLARDPAIDRLVAIKLLKEGVDSPELRERFTREARSAGRLRHQNIVTIFQVGEHESYPFIVMEYIPGDTLADIVKRQVRLTVSRKLRIIADLCRGLAYAHKFEVIHRDVKPANILVDSDGVVKILDFGIARIGEQGLTRMGMMMGTPNYMSPEQINPGTADHRSDIFTVGLVFYELLTYTRAFPGDSFAVLHNILHTEVEPVENFCPDIDPEVVSILERALKKQPTERYQDASEMRADLGRVARRLRGGLDEAADEGPIVGTSEVVITADTPTIAPRPDIEVEALLSSGLQALATDRYAEAIEIADRALALDPTNGAAADLRDQAYRASQRAKARLLLASAQAHLDAASYSAASDAIRSLEALRLSPDAESALLAKVAAVKQTVMRGLERIAAVRRATETAREQLANGDVEAAGAAVMEALRLEPGDGQALRIERDIASIAAERERTAQTAIADARALARRGEFDAAIDGLRAHQPEHQGVATALQQLLADRATAERLAQEERQRREEEERERRAEEERKRREEDARRARAEEDRRRRDIEERRRQEQRDAEAQKEREKERQRRADEQAAAAAAAARVQSIAEVDMTVVLPRDVVRQSEPPAAAKTAPPAPARAPVLDTPGDLRGGQDRAANVPAPIESGATPAGGTAAPAAGSGSVQARKAPQAWALPAAAVGLLAAGGLWLYSSVREQPATTQTALEPPEPAPVTPAPTNPGTAPGANPGPAGGDATPSANNPGPAADGNKPPAPAAVPSGNNADKGNTAPVGNPPGTGEESVPGRPDIGPIHNQFSEAMGRNDLERALGLLRTTPAAARTDPTLIADLDRLLAGARRSASDASLRSAPAASSPAFRNAQQQQAAAEKLARGGQKLQAARAFITAAGLFAAVPAPIVPASNPGNPAAPAASPDRAQLPAPTGQPPATVESPERGAVPPAGVPPAAAPPAAVPPGAVPPAAVPPVASPPVDTRAADTAQIQDLLRRYVSAYEARDFGAVRGVYPGVKPFTFDNVRTYDLVLENPQIALSGASATVTAIRRLRVQMNAGSPQQSAVRTVFTMRRDAGVWRIERIE